MIEFFSSASADGFTTEGTCTVRLNRNGATLLIQGILSGKTPQAVLDAWLETGTLSVDGLEGSFSLAVIDEPRKKTTIYRHLVGSYSLYYAASGNGFCFGSNLATVARRSGLTLRPNEAMLPALFLFRVVPGRNTLFENVFKLMPGESVTWADGHIERRQLLTLKSFDEPEKTSEEESVDRVETVFDTMLSDWHDRQPDSAVLLSGGVDSMYIQVHWNDIWRRTQSPGKPPSTAVVLDHPYTKPDFDYTMSAVQLLDTNHLNVEQPLPTAEFMAEIIDRTAEMPNHVHSFYFATLARGMKQAGFSAGICGEGADGMFGNDGPQSILAALKWGRRIPTRPLRNLCAALACLVKPDSYTASVLHLADHLNDLNYPEHPQNLSATFTDFDRLTGLFGRDGMLGAMRYRRSILDEVGVPHDPHDLQRAQLMGFFGEGIETAACWTTMMHRHDVELYNPFQDSRLIRAASNIRLDERFILGHPKRVLKKALARYVPDEFIRRPKLGFGQPVFEWLAPGGILRGAVERIGNYPWLPKKSKKEILDRPNWFLWTLLCYDLWHKAFID